MLAERNPGRLILAGIPFCQRKELVLICSFLPENTSGSSKMHEKSIYFDLRGLELWYTKQLNWTLSAFLTHCPGVCCWSINCFWHRIEMRVIEKVWSNTSKETLGNASKIEDYFWQMLIYQFVNEKVDSLLTKGTAPRISDRSGEISISTFHCEVEI